MTNRLAVAVMLAAVLAVPLRADKVTVDPNAEGGKPAKQTEPAKDLRLDKKITYYSGSKRLHAVADELSQLTGVTIRCGSTTKDWQVCDIPVVVCANDLPLGKLLRTLAEAAHVSLRTERPEEKGAELRYRLVRDKRTRDGMDAFFDSRRKQVLAESNWAWDVLTQLGGMSDDDLRKMTDSEPMLANAVLMGRLVAALGPDAKARVFAGEPVSVDGTDSPQAALVKQYCDRRRPSDDPRSSRVSFNLSDAGPEPRGVTATATVTTTTQGARIMSVEGARMMGVVTSGTMTITNKSTGAVSEVPQTIEPSMCTMSMSELGSLQDELPSSGTLAKLGFPARPDAGDSAAKPGTPSGFGEMNGEAKPLSTKVKIEKPKDVEKPTFADAVTAISKASGISIITEDFVSHKLSQPELQGSSVYGESTPAKAIRTVPNRWFSSKDGELIVGWSREWQKSHTNLMPENVLEDLRAKLKGSGVTLDDFAALTLWTQGQREDWIDRSGDLEPLAAIYVMGRDAAIWQLYATLTPEDKALVQSEAGLSFAKFDPRWLSTFFRDAIRRGSASNTPEMQPEVNTLKDASLVGGLTLSIKSLPTPTETARHYSITLSGESISPWHLSPSAFPIRAGSKGEQAPAALIRIGGPMISP